MHVPGRYIYGFVEAGISSLSGLSGLADAPVALVSFRDVAAVISRHTVKKLMPSRNNLEPHYRVVRQIGAENTVVPLAFGHIAETEKQVCGLLEINYSEIRAELDRLLGKVELGLKLRWNVANIFEYFISIDQQLKSVRDRSFRGRQPSFSEKIEIGSLFEARLAVERQRWSDLLLSTLGKTVYEKRMNPLRDERLVCNAAFLIERTRKADFGSALQKAASLLDSTFCLECDGPLPPYSFVNLRLQSSRNACNV